MAHGGGRIDTKLERQLLDFIFSSNQDRRFTQDTPILPDVWLAYANADEHGSKAKPPDILIQPWFDQHPGDLVLAWQEHLGGQWANHREKMKIAFNQSNVVAKLDFETMLGLVLPNTRFGVGMIERYAPDMVLVQFMQNFRSQYLETQQDSRRIPLLDDSDVHFCVLVGLVASLRTGQEDLIGQAEKFFDELSRLRKRTPDEMGGAIDEGKLPVRDFMKMGLNSLGRRNQLLKTSMIIVLNRLRSVKSTSGTNSAPIRIIRMIFLTRGW